MLIYALHLPSDKAAEYSMVIAGLLIAAFTVRKPGAETVAMRPTTMPAVTPGGATQAIDMEDPRR